MMLSLRTCPSLSLTFSPTKHGKNPSSSTFKPTYTRCSIKTTSSSKTTTQVVEHIVLFKVKDDTEPSKVNAMVNELRSLVTLDMVRHLTVGPLLHNNTTTLPFSSLDLRFTHLFHSRYDSKEDLEAYMAHPNHLGAVRGTVFPICDDLMAFDWVVDTGDHSSALLPHLRRGSAIRVRFLKLKDDGDAEAKVEVIRALRGIKDSTCGENISPARAKGFTIASLAVFPGKREMERVDPGEGIVKVREHLESVVVVDYVVP